MIYYPLGAAGVLLLCFSNDINRTLLRIEAEQAAAERAWRTKPNPRPELHFSPGSVGLLAARYGWFESVRELGDACATLIDRDCRAYREHGEAVRAAFGDFAAPSTDDPAAVTRAEERFCSAGLSISRNSTPRRPSRSARMDHELNDGYAIAGGTGVETGLLNDFALLQQVVAPRCIRQHFGFDKRRRFFMCLGCSSNQLDWEGGSRFAQLVEGSEDQMICAVCTRTEIVLRETCGVGGCRCDVLSTYDYNGEPACTAIVSAKRASRAQHRAAIDARIAAEAESSGPDHADQAESSELD